jgi:hypothetical protein
VKVAIHQPQYWPWPPYLHKALAADVFVYLDTVQFSKNGMQNRNQIKTAQGATWLTLPVKHEFGQSILETRIADPKAAPKHWKTLVAAYAQTNGFKLWRDELQAVLTGARTDSLCDLAIASTEWMMEKLNVRARRIRASEIPEAPEGQASELVASICKALGATTYLTGTGALAYMNPEDFKRINCQIRVQEWSGLVYEQAHTRTDFVPDLSTLDLLLNCPEQAAQLIEAAGNWRPLQN